MIRSIFSLMFLCLFSAGVWAQQSSTDEMEKLINEMGALVATDYILKVDDYRSNLERFIENKKGVCEGEFSTVILSRNDRESDNPKKPVKLTKEEREVCFRELKQIQQKYIEASYKAKKRYLIHLHELRLQELEHSKDSAIKDLTNRFNKKGRR